MPNTVNDVMNVIASPDYGIKNIASTNQEILAILSGTHNSPNNIHVIVNDVKNLLQELIEFENEKKNTELKSNTSKIINHKNIVDILDETKSIRKSINNLVKQLEKEGGEKMSSTPAVAKLSDKASEKVANAMIKSINKQNKGGGMSAIVDAFTKLKNISLKDIIFGNQKVKLISKVFKNAEKDLKIKSKDLDAIIKLINAAPEMIKALKKVDRNVNKIIKNETIKKLSDILVNEDSLLTLSKSLEKNKKFFDNATKTSKDIKELSISLNKIMKEIVFATLWSKLAKNGPKSIMSVIDELIPLSKKLVKDQKNIKNGTKAAKNITALVGNLLITSIFLTIAVVTAGPAILGALLLSLMVKAIIPVAKTLSRNNKKMLKAVGSALILTAFTGLMLITTAMLTAIASTGFDAILGAAILFGVILINVLAFKILKGAFKNILIGAISMAIMSGALILFGIALDKICTATKDVTWKQVGMIAVLTLLLGGVVAVLGIPVVTPLILLGAVSMALIGGAFILFGIALQKLVDATKDVTWKQVGMIAALTGILAVAVAFAGLLSILIIPGSLALIAMSISLVVFGISLQILSTFTKDVKLMEIGVAAISIVLLGVAVMAVGVFSLLIIPGAISLIIMSVSLLLFSITLEKIGEVGKNISLSDITTFCLAIGELILAITASAVALPFVLAGALTITAMTGALTPFVNILNVISKLKESPTQIVERLLDGISKVKDFFKDNWLEIKVTENAERYTDLMGYFSSAAMKLSLIKMIGEVPVELVKSVLGSMLLIKTYYENNEIDKKTIKQAKKHKKLMKEFGGVFKHLIKLKKMGDVPLDLVDGTLNAMNAIAQHYINNPIDDDVIDQAELYEDMLDYFGCAMKYLAKLKKMGDVPLDLVDGTLNAMNAIAQHYINNPIDDDVIDQAELYEDMLDPFGCAMKYLAKLKKMGDVPLDLVGDTLGAMNTIAQHYINNPIDDDIIDMAELYEEMLEPFGEALGYLVELKKMGDIPLSLVGDTLNTMNTIAQHYITNPIKDETIDQAELYEEMLEPFGKTLTYLANLKEMGNVPLNLVSDTLDAMNSIAQHFTNNPIDDDAVDQSELYEEVMKPFANMLVHLNKIKEIGEIPLVGVRNVLRACRYIAFYYSFTPFLATMDKVRDMNESVLLFLSTAEQLKNTTIDFTIDNYKNTLLVKYSMYEIISFLNEYSMNMIERLKAHATLHLLDKMSFTMHFISKLNASNISSVGNALSNTLNGVNNVDIDKVEAVTDMFKAFNKINRTENIIDKFTESVKDFTEACENLMLAMGDNTDAINNIDSFGFTNSPFINFTNEKHFDIGNNNNNTSSQNNGIRIINVDEIAKTIAEKINGTLSVDIPDTQIQLLINGSGGNEWTISRY